MRKKRSRRNQGKRPRDESEKACHLDSGCSTDDDTSTSIEEGEQASRMRARAARVGVDREAMQPTKNNPPSSRREMPELELWESQ